MATQSLFMEGQHPFALDQLEDTFCRGSYQGTSFEQHTRTVLLEFAETEHDLESVHEFFYQEIKELYRLNTVNPRVYQLDPMVRHRLEQIIIKHHRPH